MLSHIKNQTSYVALFDILGFSKLVETNELSRAVKTYTKARESFEDILSHINAMNNGFKIDIITEYRGFSDTFLIYTSKISERAFLSLLAACDGLFIGAIENKLLLRGAVTCGDIIAQEGVEIGRPIVDAYKNEQRQDWSGCWITPECLTDIDETKLFADKSLVEYEIPLKDGKVEKLIAFNWVKSLAWRAMFENKKNDFELEQIEKQISFINEKHTDWAVCRKLHNTRKFVEFVLTPEFIRSYKNR